MLEADGFIPLDEFSLGWRFLDPGTGEVAGHFAGRVRALTAVRAEALDHEAVARCAEPGDFTVTFRTDDSPGLVNERLRALPVADDVRIIVSWDAATAMVADWGIFVSNWDDFCYPASDDLSVWPLDGGWTLCYRHYEVLQFRSHPRGV